MYISMNTKRKEDNSIKGEQREMACFENDFLLNSFIYRNKWMDKTISLWEQNIMYYDLSYEKLSIQGYH